MPHLAAINMNLSPVRQKVRIQLDRPITFRPQPFRRPLRSHLVTDKVCPGHVEDSVNTHLLRRTSTPYSPPKTRPTLWKHEWKRGWRK